MIKVLLVEDDTIVAKIILYYLEEEKLYEVKWAKTGGEALARARESFDVILMDVLLPDVNGIDLCEKLREYHDCPILFLSCFFFSSCNFPICRDFSSLLCLMPFPFRQEAITNFPLSELDTKRTVLR